MKKAVTTLPVFLKYQQDWVLDRSRFKIGEKSRQVGLTWSTAYEAMEVAATDSTQGGSNFWYMTYAQEDAKEFIDDVAAFTRMADHAFRTGEQELTDGEEYNSGYGSGDISFTVILPEGERSIKVMWIEYSSGNRVVALPHSPRKLRGKGGVFCLDEAAYHGDLRGALKAAHAFRIWGGRVIIISTHDGKDNPFNQLCEDARTGRQDYSLHKITLLDAVADGLYKRVCAVTGEVWSAESEDRWVADLLSTEGAEEEFLCVPSSSGGAYFSMPVVDARMYADYKVIRHRLDPEFTLQSETVRTQATANWLTAFIDPVLAALPKQFPHYLGLDFGRTSDMTAPSIGYLDGEGDLHVPLVIEIRNMPYEQQKHMLFHIVDRLPRFSRGCVDATGNGAYLGEVAVQHYGENTFEAVKMNDPWYAENLPKCKARFDDNRILIPRDLDIKGDFSMIETINGVPKLPKVKQKSRLKKGELRHGDTAVSIACLCSAASHPATQYKYQKVEARKSIWRQGKGISV